MEYKLIFKIYNFYYKIFVTSLRNYNYYIKESLLRKINKIQKKKK